VSYRDDSVAALGRLAALEVELARRRQSLVALRRYRTALGEEVERLEHALTWYRNGERFGWNETDELDDLRPAELAPVRVPGAAQVMHSLAGLEPAVVTERAVRVEEELDRGDWRVARLRFDVDERRVRAMALRASVEAYARRHPDHPPPPPVRLGPELALGIMASVGGLWVALMLLAVLLGG
jgi:hypothetical protein